MEFIKGLQCFPKARKNGHSPGTAVPSPEYLKDYCNRKNTLKIPPKCHMRQYCYLFALLPVLYFNFGL